MMKLVLLCILAAIMVPSFGDITPARKAKFLNRILQVYNLTIFPNNYNVIKTGVLPDIMNENVQARVYDFAIDLVGPLTTCEYYYGLTPNNVTMPVTTKFNVNVQHFMADGDKAWSSINYLLTDLSTGSSFNATQIGQWRFDDNDKIIEIDNTQIYYDIQFRENVPDSAYPMYMAMLINQTCTREVSNCVGANQQYENYSACVDHILTLPFGGPLLNTWNSGTCRWWHSFLTFLRPDFHCPHVGPTGGGVCVDFTLASLYTPFFPAHHDRLVGPSHFVATLG